MSYFMVRIVLALLALFITAPSHANTGDIRKAEVYLQQLETARARFVQTTHNGTQYVGTFYLDRPGKLRFEYDSPIEDFIVADGLFIYFWDAELEEQTNAPIGTTLADFFLRDDLELSGDLTVAESFHEDDKLVLKIIQTDEEDAGYLLLKFDENPMSLSSWTVHDAQGLTTSLELFYLKTGMKHPRDLFVFHDPAKLHDGWTRPGAGNE